MKDVPDWKIRLYVQGIFVGVLALIAVALLGEVSRQNWHTRVTAYPTRTETAVEARAQQLLNSMTLEEKVGQMFLITCSAKEREAVIEQYAPGGIQLTQADFEGRSKHKVSALVADYQSMSHIPMLIGVTEEGGAAVPVSSNRDYRKLPFLSARELYTTGGLSLVETDTEEKCSLLKELGINTNFAPVADVTTEAVGAMYDRAVGQPAPTTARYVRSVVSVMGREKTIAAVKHFPGYGNLTGDTAAESVTDTRTMEELTSVDFLPFTEAIAEGVPIIVVGHMTCTAADEAYPASLSKEVHKVLRRDLGFDGVVATDDLTAGAIAAYCDGETAAVTAIQAGNDLICTSDTTHVEAVLQAVRMGAISEERIDESVLRILKLKIRYNLI